VDASPPPPVLLPKVVRRLTLAVLLDHTFLLHHEAIRLSKSQLSRAVQNPVVYNDYHLSCFIQRRARRIGMDERPICSRASSSEAFEGQSVSNACAVATSWLINEERKEYLIAKFRAGKQRVFLCLDASTFGQAAGAVVIAHPIRPKYWSIANFPLVNEHQRKA
jgi:hypothetical protein